ncbi:hypothetical protein [Enterococcus rivorum]|uniref:hypothetical protein n=1 Tax=Enterococcus rivorum TaxID=762845 RepID=UPI003628477F
MYHNVEVDWKTFEYIHSGRTQYTFEYLAYILFCHEFNQSIGMFRYFNQAGIETNPIDFDNEVIGFQANTMMLPQRYQTEFPSLKIW